MMNVGDGYSRIFPMLFGTPSQKNAKSPVNFDIDTRFSILVVASTDCDNDRCFPVYDYEKSSTAQVL